MHGKIVLDKRDTITLQNLNWRPHNLGMSDPFQKSMLTHRYEYPPLHPFGFPALF